MTALLPPRGGLALGVATEAGDAVRPFAAAVGAAPSVHAWYTSWADGPRFDVDRARRAADAGAVPMVTLEPWLPAAGVRQPAFALRRLLDGALDAPLARFAAELRSWGGPVLLRFLHEADAPVYPWSAGVNGNVPAEVPHAWRHARRVLERAGARNAIWIWCVNEPAAGSCPLDVLYPGDGAVDLVGVDGFDADVAPWGRRRDPDEVFGPALDGLAALTARPVVITETACAPGPGRAAWIERLGALARERDVRLVVWFEVRKEADWRVADDPAAARALRSVVGEGRPG